MDNEHWGLHLVVDCKGASPTRDIDHILGFLADLIERIEMVPVGAPICTDFTELDTNKNGWTVIQLIQTSSIVMHFCNTGDAFIDVFSCKYFDQLKVVAAVDHWFKPQELKTRVFPRG